MNIPEIFRLEGEDGFRQRETAVLAELGKRSGLVIATGGRLRDKAGKLPAAAPERNNLLPDARFEPPSHQRAGPSRRRSARRSFTGAESRCMKNLRTL